VTEYLDPEPEPEPDLETVPPAPTFSAPPNDGYSAPHAAPAPLVAPAPTEPPPPAGRGPVVAFLAGVMVVALIVGFATATFVLDARDTSSTNASAAPGPTAPGVVPTAPGPTTTVPSGPVDRDDDVLAALIVRQIDVPATATVHHLPHGADVTIGTLDLCNGTFPSDAKRTARRQVTLADANDVVHFSTEAVLYRAPAIGTEAFAELRSVVEHCPNAPVVSPIGEPTVTTTFRAAPDGAWPRKAGVQRLAYDFVTGGSQPSVPTRSIAVYLRRGRVLMGLYFPTPGAAQITVAGRTTIAGIVGIFQDRMAKLPARVVNG
jgi:hypothetical protein